MTLPLSPKRVDEGGDMEEIEEEEGMEDEEEKK